MSALARGVAVRRLVNPHGKAALERMEGEAPRGVRLARVPRESKSCLAVPGAPRGRQANGDCTSREAGAARGRRPLCESGGLRRTLVLPPPRAAPSRVRASAKLRLIFSRRIVLAIGSPPCERPPRACIPALTLAKETGGFQLKLQRLTELPALEGGTETAQGDALAHAAHRSRDATTQVKRREQQPTDGAP